MLSKARYGLGIGLVAVALEPSAQFFHAGAVKGAEIAIGEDWPEENAAIEIGDLPIRVCEAPMRLILKNSPYASGIAGRQGLGEIWYLAGAGECDARDRHCGLIGSVRQVGHSGPEVL